MLYKTNIKKEGDLIDFERNEIPLKPLDDVDDELYLVLMIRISTFFFLKKEKLPLKC